MHYQSLTIEESPKLSAEEDLLRDITKIVERASFDFEADRKHLNDSIAKLSSCLGVQHAGAGSATPPRASGGLAHRQVQRLEIYIGDHIDRMISVKELSAFVQLSPSHFSRAFKRTFRETPHSYVLRRRLELAKHLLSSTVIPLRSIAQDCGFSDQAHLCNLFRKSIGETPGTWRRDQRNHFPR